MKPIKNVSLAAFAVITILFFLEGISLIQIQSDNRSFSDLSTISAQTIPFVHHSTRDTLNRKINFYISKRDTKKLPLVLFIPGSGCNSNFRKNADGSISGGYQNLLLGMAQGSFHVMVVEKPFVNFLDFNGSGSAEKCSQSFNSTHTLEGWTAALSAAVEAASILPEVDSSKILVIGHSEGAISAASLAKHNSRISKVALLSGSGGSQLFDFIVNKSPSEVNSTYAAYEAILADPESHTRFYLGHPFKRWASFFSSSTSDLLKKTRADIFLVHGTNDTSVPVQSFDSLVVELKRTGRVFAFERIENADHSLNLPGEAPPQGMKRVFEKVLFWAGF